MTFDEVKERIPDYARDLRVNWDNLRRTEKLTPRQLWGTVLATAMASRNAQVIRAAEAVARETMEPAAADAARTAAALMAMNNVYYRFVHLASNPEYRSLPARLRMQALARPGVDRADFELWSIAVSAVNGCGVCIDSHEKKLLGEGSSTAVIQDAARVAAIVHAVAVVLDAEAAREAT